MAWHQQRVLPISAMNFCAATETSRVLQTKPTGRVRKTIACSISFPGGRLHRGESQQAEGQPARKSDGAKGTRIRRDHSHARVRRVKSGLPQVVLGDRIRDGRMVLFERGQDLL